MKNERTPLDNADEETDPIIKTLGTDLGPYQIFISILMSLTKYPLGAISLSLIYLQPAVHFNTAHCVKPANLSDPCSPDCLKVDYDRSMFRETIISEFNLICENSYQIPLSQVILIIGFSIGSLIFGPLADKYGRRPLILIGASLQLVTGLSVSLAPEYWTFVGLRFVLALSTGGLVVVCFVNTLEMLGKSKRAIVTILYQLPVAFGIASLTLFAYLCHHWRIYHLSLCMFSVVYISYFWLCPESPRWTFITGRLEKTIATLKKAAKWNRVPTEGIRQTIETAYKNTKNVEKPKKFAIIDLFRTRNLCIRTIAITNIFLFTAMSYSGIAQFMSRFTDALFINVAIPSAVTIPGVICCIPLNMFVGRRTSIIITNATSAISLILLGSFPLAITAIRVTLATIGQFATSMTYPIIYLYAGELFPTVARSSGISVCTMAAKIGSLMTIFVVDLREYGLGIPAFVYGGGSIASLLLALILPETKHIQIFNTLKDAEEFREKRPSRQ